jgi:predicted transcriptional regulator
MESTQKNTEKWQQTLDALDSAAKGKVVDASEVHKWLNSWGTDNELKAPIVKKNAVLKNSHTKIR